MSAEKSQSVHTYETVNTAKTSPKPGKLKPTDSSPDYLNLTPIARDPDSAPKDPQATDPAPYYVNLGSDVQDRPQKDPGDPDYFAVIPEDENKGLGKSNRDHPESELYLEVPSGYDGNHAQKSDPDDLIPNECSAPNPAAREVSGEDYAYAYGHTERREENVPLPPTPSDQMYIDLKR